MQGSLYYNNTVEETDIWLIRCETLPMQQMHTQTPALWLIKNQTFPSILVNMEVVHREDMSINVSLNLMSHRRVFGGLTLLISQLFCYKLKHLHSCMEVSTRSKAHITLCTLPLKSKHSVSLLSTVCCHKSFYVAALRGYTEKQTISAWQKQVFTSFYP